MSIPLFGSSEVVLHDFITFVNKDTNSIVISDKPIVSKEKMNIDIDLEITDEAETTEDNWRVHEGMSQTTTFTGDSAPSTPNSHTRAAGALVSCLLIW